MIDDSFFRKRRHCYCRCWLGGSRNWWCDFQHGGFKCRTECRHSRRTSITAFGHFSPARLMIAVVHRVIGREVFVIRLSFNLAHQPDFPFFSLCPLMFSEIPAKPDAAPPAFMLNLISAMFISAKFILSVSVLASGNIAFQACQLNERPVLRFQNRLRNRLRISFATIDRSGIRIFGV